MLSRRCFLRRATLTMVGLTLPIKLSQRASASVAQNASSLTPFVDPLPLPTLMKPVAQTQGHPLYRMVMSQFSQKLHRQLPPTTLWGYNNATPTLIEATVNQPVLVEWVNQLPTKHLFPIDYTIVDSSMPDVRNVVHLHGAHDASESDGGPINWYPPGHSALYTYPNGQAPTMLWYHDHADGITRLNNYAGLSGLYIIRDPHEAELRLPADAYEILLVIQDRLFQSNGQLFYPSQGVTPVHPQWISEFFGDTALVNSTVWPYLNVEPRKYRFRMLNSCNARWLRLSLSSGKPFILIGADGGYLPQPVQVKQILLAPSERLDVVLDFTDQVGKSITLMNDAPAPYLTGGGPTLPTIMQFRVTLPLAGRDTSSIPSHLPGPRPIAPSQAVRTRDLTLHEITSSTGQSIELLLNNMQFSAPVTERVTLGSTEIWRFINLTKDAHPIHIHLVEFQILDRQTFDVKEYRATKKVVLTGKPLPPEAGETGGKDVVRVYPGQVVRIIAQYTDFQGQYYYHCHMLEHEDNNMMRPFSVVSA